MITMEKLKIVIYMPNKSGVSNALQFMFERGQIGEWVLPRNRVVMREEHQTYIRYMCICNPYSRIVSMWNHMCNAPSSNDFPHARGLSFTKFVPYFIGKTKERHDGMMNSWFLSLTECMRLCDPHHFLRAEKMESAFKQLVGAGIPLKRRHAGVHWNTYRHREGWRDRFNRTLRALVLPFVEDDCFNFGYRVRP